MERVPNLKTALQIEVIFGVALRDMFPAFYRDAEASVIERARELYAALEGRTDAKSREKRTMLAYIIDSDQSDAPTMYD